MKIIIIGKRSNLSKSLKDKIKNIYIFGSSDIFSSHFENKIKLIKPDIVIYNSFFPLNQFTEEKNLNKIIEGTTLVTNILLKKLSKSKSIKKIILSSSSALKNLFINSFENNNKRSLYSSLKLLNEQLFIKYCTDNKIDLVIARLFNLYGNYDNSSIIYKLLNSKKNNININIFNNGNFKRDFIHTNDVVKSYIRFIENKCSGIYEVGTGQSITINELMQLSGIKKSLIKFKKTKNLEVAKSEADVFKLNKLINVNNFNKIYDYFPAQKNNYNYVNINMINLSIPHIKSPEYFNILETLDSNWVSPVGPQINKLENDLSNYNRYGYCAAVSSGTAAIHLALINLGVGRNDYVLCQSFTFVASANPILYQQAIPVFIDSEIDTLSMDPDALEHCLSHLNSKNIQPKAVIAAHIYGIPGKIYKLKKICKKYNVQLIEDSAETLGASINNIKCGTLGDIGVYSFNGNKIITSGGGGAVISKNQSDIKKIKSLSTQSRENYIYYHHKKIGYNYRMSNVLASIARAQLKDLDNKIKNRKKNYLFYKKYLKKFSNINIIEYNGSSKYLHKSNYWFTNILFKKIKFNQLLQLIDDLRKENIETRPLWKPMHMQPVFKNYKYFGNNNSEYFFQRGLSLPSSSNLTLYELNYIINKLDKYLLKYE